MKTLLLIIAGAAIGYRLPSLVERLRHAVRRRILKPILLRPYDPLAEEGANAGDRGKGRT